MKTLAGWEQSGVSLSQYLRPGDEVDASLYCHMLCECGNPAFWRAGVFAVDEPSCDVGGELYYAAFRDRGVMGYQFLGDQSIDALARFADRVRRVFN